MPGPDFLLRPRIIQGEREVDDGPTLDRLPCIRGKEHSPNPLQRANGRIRENRNVVIEQERNRKAVRVDGPTAQHKEECGGCRFPPGFSSGTRRIVSLRLPRHARDKSLKNRSLCADPAKGLTSNHHERTTWQSIMLTRRAEGSQ